MRIVSGMHRGRRLVAPPGDTTRPTTDRVREALMSALASRLEDGFAGITVLDLFAGSGALGLEALSRGASGVTFVERDTLALKALRANIASLGEQSATRVVAGEAGAALRRGALRGAPFALLLLDPPYRLDASVVGGLLLDAARRGVLSQGAIVTLEHDAGIEPVWPDGYELLDRKRYGSTAIDIARYERGTGDS